MARHRGSSVPTHGTPPGPLAISQPTSLPTRWVASVPVSQRKQRALQSAGKASLASAICSKTSADGLQDIGAALGLQSSPAGRPMYVGGSGIAGSNNLKGIGAPLGLQSSSLGMRPQRKMSAEDDCLQALASPRGLRSSPRGPPDANANAQGPRIGIQSSQSASLLVHGFQPRLSVSADPATASQRVSHNSAQRAVKSASAASGIKPKWRFMANVGNNATTVWKIMRERPGWISDGPRSLVGIAKPHKGKASESRAEAVADVAVKAGPKYDAAFFAVEMPNLFWAQKPNKAFLDAMIEERNAGSTSLRVHNHFEGIAHLCTKCGLAKSLSAYYLERGRDPFGAMPLSFIVHGTEGVPEWRKAFEAFAAEGGQRLWLLKPGGWSNQGSGIGVYNNADDVEDHLKRNDPLESQDSLDYPGHWVAQKYIEQPLLLHGRKFDIRSWCLVRQEPNGGGFSVFFYEDGYVRTTTAAFTTKSTDRLVHLGNDAVQCHGDNYGRYEPNNKMSWDDLQRHFDHHHDSVDASLKEKLVPQMKSLMSDAVRSVLDVLNPRQFENCFEIYGFDFAVDANYRVWLLEVNTNPSLELVTSWLSYVIPKMVDEALHLTVDRLFPSPAAGSATPATRPTCWTQIYNAADDAADISATWLPRTNGKEVDPSSLGRDLLLAATPPVTRKSRSPTKSGCHKASKASVPS